MMVGRSQSWLWSQVFGVLKWLGLRVGLGGVVFGSVVVLSPVIVRPVYAKVSSSAVSSAARPQLAHSRLAPATVRMIHSYFSHEQVSQRLKGHVQKFTAKPHPFGSKAQVEMTGYIRRQLRQLDVFLAEHTFRARVPHRQQFLRSLKHAPSPPHLQPASSGRYHRPTQWFSGINVLAKVPGRRQCTIIFGSHYDTKLIEKGTYLGANDSASSSAALFEIIRFFMSYNQQISGYYPPICSMVFVWFDGEESVLDHWDDGVNYYGWRDNTYGSRQLAKQLVSGSLPPAQLQLPSQLDRQASVITGVIVLDMIGSAGMRLTPEQNSAPELRALLAQAVSVLDLQHRLGAQPLRIEDDHLAFMKRGLSAINLIDFYHLQHWHQPSDLEVHLDYNAIIDAAKIAIAIALMRSYSAEL